MNPLLSFIFATALFTTSSAMAQSHWRTVQPQDLPDTAGEIGYLQAPNGRVIEIETREVRRHGEDLQWIGVHQNEPVVLYFSRHQMISGVLPIDGHFIHLSQNGSRRMGGMVPSDHHVRKSDNDEVEIQTTLDHSDFRIPPVELSLKNDHHHETQSMNTGDQVVEILGVITQELIEQEGTENAARAVFMNHFEMSRQAFINSGTGIELELVGLTTIYVPARINNADLLDGVTNGNIGGQLHRLRDQLGADLVTVLRPHPGGNTCGIAWINGGGGQPERTNARFGYSVSNIGPCSPYAMAHEIGHNFGSQHNRENSSGYGGAYPYSHGHTTETFATVMSYARANQTMIGRFSDPNAVCDDQACGTGESDNVRSLRQMRGAIAAFRAPTAQTYIHSPVLEIEERQGRVWVPVYFSRMTTTATTLRYSVTHGTTNTGDVIITDGLVTVNSGVMAAMVPIDLLDDQVSEFDEYAVVLLNIDDPNVVVSGQIVVRVIDNDHPTISFSPISIYEGNNGAREVLVEGVLNRNSPFAFTLTIESADGTALAGEDYLPVHTTIDIAQGQRTFLFPVTILGDTTVESNEIFSIYLSSSRLNQEFTHDLSILNDDGTLPSIYIDDVAVIEGNAGYTTAMVRVWAEAPVGQNITLNMATFNSSAMPGVDYVSWSGSIVLPRGEQSVLVPVNVIGDTLVEDNKVFGLRINSTSGARVIDNSSAITIIDDDRPAPTLRLEGPEFINEGSFIHRQEWQLMASATHYLDIEAQVRTVDGTAQAGTDYESLYTTVRIPANTTSATFGLFILGDVEPEANETFIIQVDQIIGSSTTSLQRTVVLNNDDQVTVVARDDGATSHGFEPVSIAVLANDQYSGSANVTMMGSARLGQLRVINNQIEYIPQQIGVERLSYRVCVAQSCSEAWVYIQNQALNIIERTTPHFMGSLELNADALANDPNPSDWTWMVSGLSQGQAQQISLSADSNRQPWDSAQGRVVEFFTATADTLVAVESSSPLYLGRDVNENGLAEAEEVLCMNTISETCLMSVVTDEVYWVMHYNPNSTPVVSEYVIAHLGSGHNTPQSYITGSKNWSADIPAIYGWNTTGWREGERRWGAYFVRRGDELQASLIDLTLENAADTTQEMMANQNHQITLQANQIRRQIFVNVPLGTEHLTFNLPTTQGLVYRVYHQANALNDISTMIRKDGVDLLMGSSQGGVLRIATQQRTGIWFIEVENQTALTQNLALSVVVEGEAVDVTPGSYYNHQRSGLGVYWHVTGPELTAIWYAYMEDGTPTWYFMQGTQVDGSNGHWTAPIYRSVWSNGRNTLTAIGQATFTAQGQNRIGFSYTLDGVSGYEVLTQHGEGCPVVDGQTYNASAHWFDPMTNGTGWSAQTFAHYESYALFAYDESGWPRFLIAEGPTGSQNSTFPVYQVQGFCPTCVKTQPQLTVIGEFQRLLGAQGEPSYFELDAQWNGMINQEVWARRDNVVNLDPEKRTQGCL